MPSLLFYGACSAGGGIGTRRGHLAFACLSVITTSGPSHFSHLQNESRFREKGAGA